MNIIEEIRFVLSMRKGIRNYRTNKRRHLSQLDTSDPQVMSEYINQDEEAQSWYWQEIERGVEPTLAIITVQLMVLQRTFQERSLEGGK